MILSVFSYAFELNLWFLAGRAAASAGAFRAFVVQRSQRTCIVRVFFGKKRRGGFAAGMYVREIRGCSYVVHVC